MFSQPMDISWQWHISALPEEIWPFISDTNRLFKDIGRPSIQETDISQTVEPGFAQLSYNRINRYEVWEEEPYEWEYPFHFGVVRHYQAGAYKDIEIQLTLQPNDYGTLLNLQFQITPRMPLMSAFNTLKFKTLIKRNIKNTLLRYDELALQEIRPYQRATKDKLPRSGRKRLKQLLKELHNSEVDASILNRIVKYIRKADDLQLKRIRPYELADFWDLPRQDVLKVFIHATKTGLLTFNWDLYCPHCRTIQHSVKTLSQIHEPIHCNDCDTNFSVNFNKTIQLSFRPHPLIRKVKDEQYCNRGPQSRPHIFVQQYLAPKEKRFLKTKLPTGQYILRSNKSDGHALITVKKNSSNTVLISLQEEGFNGEQVNISCEPNLSLKNNTSEPQLFMLERKQWKKNGVSAAEATSSQLFRNLFADEVLRKGEKISVDNLSLMFTDLFDSTGIYTEEGDSQAVSQMIDHFEILQEAIADHNGAIVKTIGDSVMAVFCKPEDAFRAYLGAQKMLSYDERFDDHLQLKAGIHHGSCVAVNLNSRIDYFGSTVNIASRFVDLASGNEVILSEDTFSKAELQSMLKKSGHISSVKNLSTQLKGFQSKPFAIKSITIEDTPLRLAVSKAAS
ncbi:adenylate/guanylate cyclase domain-containing protein [Fodinibius halophilus]|uniref:Adenylate/guanylate cyclase domain-containing protein n=1 Tax=Fodinibius halophilus TaxID=1736908 RepID=A0A6M1T5H1_9BACT|nr:adenylate/guanylate cyclase domain-containing protein [Fodinibius halophilus]NGP89337.1 adenylate/guanylate cyclase domain-containing protein [Fodinibius halophilus]